MARRPAAARAPTREPPKTAGPPAALAEPPVPLPAPVPKWHLGFDCATKTFAFSLSRVDLAAFRAAKARLRAQALAALEVLRRAALLAHTDLPGAAALVAAIAASAAAADLESRSFVRIVDGATVDLFPGRADDSIPTVERLRGVARYVAERVRPAVARCVPADEPCRVVIEFQSINPKTRPVKAALVALFADLDTIIVGPTLKNKIATREEGRYCYFAERYMTSYSANKAHAAYNFDQIERAFGSEIPATRPLNLRGHIADSFMQVLGHLVHGNEEKAATMF
jgi:hypothetical protein